MIRVETPYNPVFITEHVPNSHQMVHFQHTSMQTNVTVKFFKFGLICANVAKMRRFSAFLFVWI